MSEAVKAVMESCGLVPVGDEADNDGALRLKGYVASRMWRDSSMRLCRYDRSAYPHPDPRRADAANCSRAALTSPPRHYDAGADGAQARPGDRTAVAKPVPVREMFCPCDTGLRPSDSGCKQPIRAECRGPLTLAVNSQYELSGPTWL